MYQIRKMCPVHRPIILSHHSFLGILPSLTPHQTIQMTGHLYLSIMTAAWHVWTMLDSIFFYEFK